MDKKTIDYVAHLSRIDLKPEELDKLSAQLEEILDFIDKLKKLNIENIQPTSHISPISNVARPDDLKDSLPTDNALENAPRKQAGSFVVPKVIE